MGALIDIILDGVKKFGGQIVAGILLAVALGLFPSLRKLFKRKDDSAEEVKEELKKLKSILNESLKKENSEDELQKQLDVLKQEEEQLAHLKGVLQRHDEALKLTETQTAEEARQREEAQRQLEAMKKSSKVQSSGNWYKHPFIAIAILMIFAIIIFVDEYDLKEDVERYRKAAEQGDYEAQYLLGKSYYNANGVKQDFSEALKWYRKSAEQGYAHAQFALGIMYYNGFVVRHNNTEAVKWWKKAAEQGDEDAQYWLGFMYEHGLGVVQDLQEARKLYQKAANQGEYLAISALKRLNAQ